MNSEPCKPTASSDLVTRACEEEPDCIFNYTSIDSFAIKSPTKPAIIDADQKVSFASLKDRSDRLASVLQLYGAAREVCVGIMMPRCAALVIGMVGIHKSGAAVVPIDPSTPNVRVSQIIADSKLSLLLVNGKQDDQLDSFIGKCRVVDIGMESDIFGQSTGNFKPNHLVGGLSNVLYTSGSTGMPKGVMGFHQNTANHKTKSDTLYAHTDKDCHLLKSPVGFTLLIREVYLPLRTGATLVIVRDGSENDVQHMIELMIRFQITTLTVIPGLLKMFVEHPSFERCRALNFVACYGEPLTRQLVERFKANSNAMLAVMYGCTEAPGACQMEISRAMDLSRILLGKPVSGVPVYILDRMLNPVPPGKIGELYIGGSLTRGYLRKPGLTAERYRPDPFSNEPGARMYASGDQARRLPDDTIEYIGRADHQVKIRGKRVELFEVERRMCTHSHVSEATAVVWESEDLHQQLLIYVVLKGNSTANIVELRNWMAAALPDYMIPARYIILPCLPRGVSGKVDRRLLPAPDSSRPLPARAVPPATDTERTLTGIWQQSLGIDPIGIEDNYFELGGDSLHAVKIFAELELCFGLHQPISLLLEKPTIFQLAKHIDTRQSRQQSSVIVPLKPDGHKTPVFLLHAQAGNIFFYQELAKLIDADRAVYAIQSVFLVDLESMPGSLEELAALYLKEIMIIQPHGPYLLCGRCFGGIMMVEIAHQLLASGEEVDFLCVLDSAPPRIRPNTPVKGPAKPGISSRPPGKRTIRQLLLLLYGHWKNRRLTSVAKNFITANLLGDILENINGFVRNLLYLNPDRLVAVCFRKATGRTHYQLQRGNFMNRRLKKKYVSREYPGYIVQVRSSEFARKLHKSRHQDWEKVCGGRLNTHIIKGGHHSLFTTPYVDTLAEKIRHEIDSSESRRATHSTQSENVTQGKSTNLSSPGISV